jgi:plastocyanin
LQAYSQDLRERVVRACDEQRGTRQQIADLFGVSTAWIRRLLPESAEAQGRRFYGGPVYYSAPVYYQPCMPAYYPAPVYYAPGVYYGPPIYYQQPHSYPPSYAPGYSPARPTTAVNVGAYDNYFEPKAINVQPGTTVRWVNYGNHAHTVTSNDGRWDSGDIQPGATYSATFQHPGTYYFYCRHHTKDRMQGTIVVGSGGGGGYGGSGSSGY